MLGGILNGVQKLVARLTATRAGYLDNLTNLNATISSRASATDYTSQRAGYIDKLNVSGSVLSDQTYTTARAARLDNIWRPLAPKNQAYGVLHAAISLVDGTHDALTGKIYHHPIVDSVLAAEDRELGLVVVRTQITADGTLKDVLASTSGKGYVLAAALTAGGTARTVRGLLTIDGIEVWDTGATSLAGYTQWAAVAIPFKDSAGKYGFIMNTQTPVRFETSVRFQGQSESGIASTYFTIIYVLE